MTKQEVQNALLDIPALIAALNDAGVYVEAPPPACTGYVYRPGEIRHDGDTCPVHEAGA